MLNLLDSFGVKFEFCMYIPFLYARKRGNKRERCPVCLQGQYNLSKKREFLSWIRNWIHCKYEIITFLVFTAAHARKRSLLSIFRFFVTVSIVVVILVSAKLSIHIGWIFSFSAFLFSLKRCLSARIK